MYKLTQEKSQPQHTHLKCLLIHLRSPASGQGNVPCFKMMKTVLIFRRKCQFSSRNEIVAIPRTLLLVLWSSRIHSLLSNNYLYSTNLHWTTGYANNWHVRQNVLKYKQHVVGYFNMQGLDKMYNKSINKV